MNVESAQNIMNYILFKKRDTYMIYLQKQIH